MGSKLSVEVLPSTDSPEEVQLSIKKMPNKKLADRVTRLGEILPLGLLLGEFLGQNTV